MAMNRIMGTEAQKMQDYAREQIERAERRGITFPEDVKEDIFRYADLIGEEDKVRSLVRNLARATEQSNKEQVQDLLYGAEMEIRELPDETLGRLELLDYGYTADDMVPLRKEAALEYHRTGSKIYCLGTDGSKGEYASREMILEHNGFYDENFRLMDGGVYESPEQTIEEAADVLLKEEGWTGDRIRGEYDELMEKVEKVEAEVMKEIQRSQGEYKPLAKVEELEEANYNMIDNVLNNMPPKKEPYLEYYAAEYDEFHGMGGYEKSIDLSKIAAIYEKYQEDPESSYKICGMGIIYRDPEDSLFDETELGIVRGTTIHGDALDDVRFLRDQPVVREGIEKIREAFPDYRYIPIHDVREAMYPEKMTTEELAEALDKIAEDFDPYDYRDHIEPGENTIQEVMLDLQSGNIGSYISYLKDIVEEECEQSVRAGVLIERLKTYEPELQKEPEPMAYVNYCENRELMNPRCQKLADLDALVARQDKECRFSGISSPCCTARRIFMNSFPVMVSFRIRYSAILSSSAL